MVDCPPFGGIPIVIIRADIQPTDDRHKITDEARDVAF